MPKLKTRKAVAKRFKITSNGKVFRRASKQNHFNARQTSNKKRSKRTDMLVLPLESAKDILRDIPYSN